VGAEVAVGATGMTVAVEGSADLAVEVRVVEGPVGIFEVGV